MSIGKNPVHMVVEFGVKAELVEFRPAAAQAGIRLDIPAPFDTHAVVLYPSEQQVEWLGQKAPDFGGWLRPLVARPAPV